MLVNCLDIRNRVHNYMYMYTDNGLAQHYIGGQNPSKTWSYTGPEIKMYLYMSLTGLMFEHLANGHNKAGRFCRKSCIEYKTCNVWHCVIYGIESWSGAIVWKCINLVFF